MQLNKNKILQQALKRGIKTKWNLILFMFFCICFSCKVNNNPKFSCLISLEDDVVRSVEFYKNKSTCIDFIEKDYSTKICHLHSEGHFTVTHYDSNKVETSFAYYIDRFLSGHAIHYFPDGKVEQTTNFKNGKMEGIQIAYDSFGDLMGYELIFQGESVFKMVYDKDVNGQFTIEGTPVIHYDYDSENREDKRIFLEIVKPPKFKVELELEGEKVPLDNHKPHMCVTSEPFIDTNDLVATVTLTDSVTLSKFIIPCKLF